MSFTVINDFSYTKDRLRCSLFTHILDKSEIRQIKLDFEREFDDTCKLHHFLKSIIYIVTTKIRRALLSAHQRFFFIKHCQMNSRVIYQNDQTINPPQNDLIKQINHKCNLEWIPPPPIRSILKRQ